MNLLIDELPKTVWVNGREYDIRWSFRYSILYELIMTDTSLDIEERTAKGLELYYPIIPTEQEEAAAMALWFYRCAGKGREGKGDSRKALKAQPVYSFDYDDGYIYAAFWEQYGIDLSRTNLHWWEFRALFWGLNDKCMFSKIMGYRSMEIGKDMTKAQKDFYHKMKELYALPVSEQEQEKLKAIDAVLMGNGDLTGVL